MVETIPAPWPSSAVYDTRVPIIRDGMKSFGAVLCDQTGLALSNCNARIEQELTPEQKIKFAEIENEQQQCIRSRFNGGPPPKIP